MNALRFGNHDSRRPPNYFSRRSQTRLLLMTLGLMGAVWVMFEARKPENWRWLWAFSQETPDDPSVDTRPDPVAEAEGGEPGSGLFIQPNPPSLLQDADPAPSLDEIRFRAWDFVFDQLEAGEGTLLDRALRLWLRDGTMPEDAGAWQALIVELDAHWNRWYEVAFAELVNQPRGLDETQRAQWLQAILEVRAYWAWLKTQLASLADGSDSQPDRDRIQQVSRAVERIAWSSIEDNTVFRRQEASAWDRAWDLVAESSGGEAEEVTFYQLFTQPDFYRGKQIAFRGTARLGYRLQGSGEDAAEYAVLWIQPADNSDTPLVAYCRTLPEGFPELPHRDDEPGATRLEEEVVIEGVFFKRWLYPSDSGPNLAPLVLVQQPGWTATAAVEPEGSAPESWPAWLALVAVAAGGAAVVWWTAARLQGTGKLPTRPDGPPERILEDDSTPAAEETDREV